MNKIFTNCSTTIKRSGALTALLAMGLSVLSFGQERISDPKHDGILHPEERHSTNYVSQDGLESLSVQAMVVRPGKSQNYYPDNTTGEWSHNSNSVYEYNAQGKLLNRYDLAPATNDTLSKTSYKYDRNGYMSESVSSEWNNGEWQVTYGFRYASTYDNNGNEIELVYSRFRNGAWSNYIKYVSIYDERGNEIEYTRYNWINETWVKYVKYNMTYDDLNKSYNAYEYIIYENNVEIARSKVLLNRDEQNRITSDTTYSYLDNTWNISSRNLYVYGENGGYVRTTESLNNGEWIPVRRATFIYDGNKNITEYKSEVYENQVWSTSYHDVYLYTYNDNNEMTERIYKGWDNLNKTLKNSWKETYSDFQYYTVTGASAKLAKLQVNTYPNPTTGLLTIQGEVAENTSLQINDMTGRTVMSKELNFGNSQQVDLSALPAGIYLLNVKSKEGVYTSRVVKQ